MPELLSSKEFSPIVHLYTQDAAGSIPETWATYNGFYISSVVNELVIKTNLHKNELILDHIQVSNQNSSLTIQTLEFLTNYASKKGFDKLILDCTLTNEMKEFAELHGFEEKTYQVSKLAFSIKDFSLS